MQTWWPSGQTLQWRVCHVLRRVIHVTGWCYSKSTQDVQASFTPLWVLFSWTCGCRKFPYPSALRSSLPLHRVCKWTTYTDEHFKGLVYEYLVCCLSVAIWLTHRSHIRDMLKGIWELVWKSLRPNHKLSSALCTDWWQFAKSEMNLMPCSSLTYVFCMDYSMTSVCLV